MTTIIVSLWWSLFRFGVITVHPCFTNSLSLFKESLVCSYTFKKIRGYKQVVLLLLEYQEPWEKFPWHKSHAQIFNLKPPGKSQEKFLVPQLLSYGLIFNLLWPNHALLLSFIIAAQLRISKTLITFHRYALIFNVMKPLKNLSMAHGPVLKESFITSVWSQFSWLLRKIWYMHSSVSWISGIWCRHKHNCLPVMTMSDWMAAVTSCWLRASRTTSRHVQKSLPQCDIRYKRNELNAYTFWSSLIHRCENTSLNLLNYSTIQRWVVSFHCTDWIESLEAPDLVWSFEEEKNLLLLPLSSSQCIQCTNELFW